MKGLEDFVSLLENDEQLKKEFEALTTVSDFISKAESLGFELSEDEAMQLIPISDETLKNISGGSLDITKIIPGGPVTFGPDVTR